MEGGIYRGPNLMKTTCRYLHFDREIQWLLFLAAAMNKLAETDIKVEYAAIRTVQNKTIAG